MSHQKGLGAALNLPYRSPGTACSRRVAEMGRGAALQKAGDLRIALHRQDSTVMEGHWPVTLHSCLWRGAPERFLWALLRHTTRQFFVEFLTTRQGPQPQRRALHAVESAIHRIERRPARAANGIVAIAAVLPAPTLASPFLTPRQFPARFRIADPRSRTPGTQSP